MITFSTHDAAELTAASTWQVDRLLDPVVLALAAMLAVLWTASIALDFVGNHYLRGAHRVLMVLLAIAVTVNAEQGGPGSASQAFEPIQYVVDGLSMRLVLKDDTDENAGFFDAATQFPLRQRMKDDFGSSLDSATASSADLFTDFCLRGDVLAKLTARDEPGAKALLPSKYVRLSGGAEKKCSELNTEVGTGAETSRGSKSYFSARRSVTREVVRWRTERADASGFVTSERVDRLLTGETPISDPMSLPYAGRFHGEVSAGFVRSFIFAPLFVQLPGGVGNILLYTFSFAGARYVTGYWAYELHKIELDCIAQMDAVDANDTSLEALHAYYVQFVEPGADATYMEIYNTCMVRKQATHEKCDYSLAGIGLLLAAAWLKLNW